MFDRQPPPDDPAWAEAPLDALLRPLTSEWAGLTATRHFHGNGRTDAAKTPQPETKPRRKWSKITPEQEANAAERILEDIPYAQIAVELGIGQSTVERIASDRGIGRGRGWTRRPPLPLCAVPDCGRKLKRDNKSGVCGWHRHAVGFCRCPACEGVGSG